MDAAAAAGPSSSAAPAAAARPSSGAEPSAAAAAQPAPVAPRMQLLQAPLLGAGGAGSGSGSGDARACRHHAYSRKQKSLGLLCSKIPSRGGFRFVALYDREDVETIGLDDAAKQLGVERRRIYDIVNVLESVGILVRRAKNRYTWLGFGGVPAALKELKERALREMSGSPVFPPMEESSTANLSVDEDDEKLEDADEDAESEKLSQSVDNTSDKPDAPGCRLRSDHRKEKSLGLLTQNFVKLFLTMEVETFSLDEAARLLLGEGHAESNMRTKVRRLYDIANVLSSLNLIEKTQQADTRKPAFRWLGQAKRKQENNTMIALPTARPNKRAFGTDLTNFDNKWGRLDPTTEDKAKLMQGAGNIVKTFERQLGQGNRSDFVYGPFHPAVAKKQESDDHTVRQKERKTIQDWENLAVSFRPQYQNQAVDYAVSVLAVVRRYVG
ncbi:E2F transcription factor-like E2FE isoform X3 [Panicum virgatum]|uniref:E2F transcription factor-like E2FE isoform X3 n=1 Tax=Panicum virgatum TaxID=38727 RepID=UPI0019D5FED9|nr:E2F transcription factor-like E2FE isoform X3 [Panicum virgatum]XP_039842937.1 E2F transcription factor-like E2FE isoform X3 [Panicum virgatum]XP_039842938.1 E2F transcription factor-like E2FE isoform X3 [Panicum virgatum]